MSGRRRTLAAALSSVALLTTLSACGGSATGQEADALSDVSLVFGGALTVCTDSPYAPFVYEEKGKLVGFDVDLAKQVADALKVDLDVIDVAIQLHGGAGVSDDFPLASAWVGARTLRLADGPDEVHRNVIAKIELGKHTA